MLLTNNSEYKIFNVNHKINSELIFKEPIPLNDIKKLEIIYLCIKYVAEFLEKHNIDYCISDGTLLGCIRHDGIIPWDSDFDIIIFRDGYFKLKTLMKEFENDNFNIINITPGYKIFYDKIPFGELFVYDMDMNTDGLYKLAYPYIMNRPMFTTSKLYFPWQKYKNEDIFPLKKAQFEDFIVCVPNNPLNILNTTYKGNMKECRFNADLNDQHCILGYNTYYCGMIFEKIFCNPLFFYIYYIVHLIISKNMIKFH